MPDVLFARLLFGSEDKAPRTDAICLRPSLLFSPEGTKASSSIGGGFFETFIDIHWNTEK